MFAIVDIETTGGTPQKARITEIAILIHDGKKVIDTYSTLVNPERSIDPFVVRLTGITDEMVQDAPLFSSIIDKVEELTADKIFVAHNSKFDYSFLRREYRRLHRRFQRKHICTVKMSQQFLPGHPSYSLSKLCKSLKIPMDNKHRALDDTVATAKLFDLLLEVAPKEELEAHFKDDFINAEFPDYIDKQEINNLPEDVGIFYFLNEEGIPIYIQKSKNIRQKVISYYTNLPQSKKNQEIVQHTMSVDYLITGSELIADLLEFTEIKKHQPTYNNYKERKYRYGLYTNLEKDGYLRIVAKPNNNAEQPIIEFTTKKMAEKALSQIRKTFNFNQPSRQRSKQVIYNARVEEALSRYHFDYSDFVIIDEGRKHLEKTVLLVENGKFYGYDFINQELLEDSYFNEAIEEIPKHEFSTEMQQIIKKHLNKKNKLKIIHLY